MSSLERSMDKLAEALRNSILLTIEEQEFVLEAIVAYQDISGNRKQLHGSLILKFSAMVAKNKQCIKSKEALNYVGTSKSEIDS